MWGGVLFKLTSTKMEILYTHTVHVFNRRHVIRWRMVVVGGGYVVVTSSVRMTSSWWASAVY